ncbi:MAG: YeeE/YedE family protein [Proteobacteria bacterium]|nr:YeeE/YedE family protein [Pseudomonadota bacterium]
MIGNAFLGGVLIGSAAILMLVLNGRIMGISGIVGGAFNSSTRAQSWRYFFFGGMILGGLVLRVFHPQSLENTLSRSNLHLILAGFLVGWGTRLGSGCTSGHGICGVSRISPRSLLATGIFMFFGILTVWVMNRWGLTT